jgi:predicted transcriptional regulator
MLNRYSKFEVLDRHKAVRALRLWQDGKDTHEISRIIGVPEFYVFNSLRAMREANRVSPNTYWSLRA